jgi:hypothetical protein
MRNWKVVLIVCWLILVGVMCVGCLSPEELNTAKVQLAEVKNLSAKCATADQETCCKGLAAAEKAMETMIIAAED